MAISLFRKLVYKKFAQINKSINLKVSEISFIA